MTEMAAVTKLAIATIILPGPRIPDKAVLAVVAKVAVVRVVRRIASFREVAA
jgi:hypothetical protein